MKDFFDDGVQKELMQRINKLTPTCQPKWGKMNVAQMLAHLNVMYEMVYEAKHPRPNALTKLLLKWFVKKGVVNEVPYKKNTPTAPQFRITAVHDFQHEKNRLVEYMDRTLKLGSSHFDGKEYVSFGVLTRGEWSNMFYKHIDHHLSQFGV